MTASCPGERRCRNSLSIPASRRNPCRCKSKSDFFPNRPGNFIARRGPILFGNDCLYNMKPNFLARIMTRHFFLAPLLAAILLAGCAVAPPTPSWDEVLTLPPDQAWSLTGNWPETERPARQLELLDHWARQQQWEEILIRLPEIDADALDSLQRTRVRLIEAESLLHSGEELAALTTLSSLPDDDATLALRVRVYEQLDDPENALRIRLQIVSLPGDPTERDAQYRQAWGDFHALPGSRLEHWRNRTGDETWRGWLDLALITRTDGRPHSTPQQALEEWQRLYRLHPAWRWLPSISESLAQLHPALRKLAVLIPISGDFSNIGRAIRAGIEASMRQHPGDAPNLHIYDTGDSEKRPSELYQQAIAEGADRIIGPFDKMAVAQLARTGSLPIDTISLNYLDDYVEVPENLYQFGLLPEDEAIQAAMRALQDGRRSAIVFAPANTWGQRLDQAFTQRFEEGGGVVRGHGFYFANASDHAAKIKDILKLSEGERRKQMLEETLNQEVTYRPARRQDIDMVFLASSPRNARLFKPQLDFYYAGDLPLYATSHIYTGIPSPLQDRDLEGVMFCDIPLVLDDRLREKLGTAQVARQLPRFAALGADAYLLATSLNYLNTYPNTSLEGWTGKLSLHEQRRVFRTLEWARFQDGRALPTPTIGHP